MEITCPHCGTVDTTPLDNLPPDPKGPLNGTRGMVVKLTCSECDMPVDLSIRFSIEKGAE